LIKWSTVIWVTRQLGTSPVNPPNAGMSCNHNGLRLAAKNYDLDVGLVDAVALASSCVASFFIRKTLLDVLKIDVTLPTSR